MSKHSARTSDDPVIDTRVQEILTAAAAPVEATGPSPGEEQALEAFRTFAKPTKRPSRLSRHASVKAAVATAIGTGVLLAGGVGAAADGVLPGAAQQTASTVLRTIGISVPPGDGADTNGRPEQTPGNRADHNTNPRGSEAAEVPPAADHGKQVSETAKSPADGARTGRDVARVASDNQANSGNQTNSGDHGQAAEDHGQPPRSHPNPGDTGNASPATNGQQHSDGAADHGTATANQSSNGANSNGSDNHRANH